MQDPVIDAIHRRLDALEQTRPKQRACTEINSRNPLEDRQSPPAEGCAPGFEWALHPAPPRSERCILVCETTPQFRQLAASLPSQADAVIEVNCYSPLLLRTAAEPLFRWGATSVCAPRCLVRRLDE